MTDPITTPEQPDTRFLAKQLADEIERDGRMSSFMIRAGLLDDILKALDALRSRIPASGEGRETVWLVERNDIETPEAKKGATLYMWHYVGDEFSWTPDPLKAERFPTKEAAEEWMQGADSLSACEHVFGLSTPTQPPTLDREAVARIVNPGAFADWYIHDHPGSASKAQADALNVADAILSLITPQPAGDAEGMLARATEIAGSRKGEAGNRLLEHARQCADFACNESLDEYDATDPRHAEIWMTARNAAIAALSTKPAGDAIERAVDAWVQYSRNWGKSESTDSDTYRELERAMDALSTLPAPEAPK
jgi:hypothetical protein